MLENEYESKKVNHSRILRKHIVLQMLSKHVTQIRVSNGITSFKNL